MADPLTPLYTTPYGPGYTTPQAVPSASLGGFASVTAYGGGVLGDLFGMASSIDVANARADFRALYVYNPSATDTVYDVRAYLTAVTAGAAQVAVGVDPRPVTYYDSTAAQAVEPTSSYNAPSGVAFTLPAGYADGVRLGDLPPLTGRALWVKRVPVTSADAAAESTDLTVSDGGANAIVRRVTWMTEAAAAPTAPFRFPTFTATSTPFRRVMVDYVTAGGPRITWEVDKQLRDEGPYHYQLQASQVGTPDADDWADVGPPARDVTFLVDPSRRLWGASPTVHYRVLLTTAEAAYTSPASSAYGMLNKRQWLTVQEVFRKEQLMLRQFTGINGYLLKARRYGQACPSCVDPINFEVTNSSCPVCYGTGVSDGYHAPLQYAVVDAGNENYREQVAYNENLGTIADAQVIKGRVLATVPVFSRDAWVLDKSDRRYYVHRVTTAAAHLGVPIVYDVELRQAPRSDVLYVFPFTRPDDIPPPYAVYETINL